MVAAMFEPFKTNQTDEYKQDDIKEYEYILLNKS